MPVGGTAIHERAERMQRGGADLVTRLTGSVCVRQTSRRVVRPRRSSSGVSVAAETRCKGMFFFHLFPLSSGNRCMLWALMLAVIAGCSATARRAPETDPTSVRIVYIISHGSHAGLAVRTDDIPAGVLPEREDFPDARYLEVGWGDWDFYQARDFSFWLMLKAGLWPTPSVLLVEPLYVSPRGRYPCSRIIELRLDAVRFMSLLNYVNGSFDRHGTSRAAALPPLYPQPGRFYPAHGRFHAFNTCNVWTSRALTAGGYPLTAPRPLTAGCLMAEVRHFGYSLAPAPACRRP